MDLVKLRDTVGRLNSILQDDNQWCISWQEAVADLWKQIAEMWSDDTRKLQAIRKALTFDRVAMTTSELEIDVILTGNPATDQEKKNARDNVDAITEASEW